MNLLVVLCVLSVAFAGSRAAPVHGLVTPVILPKVHVTSPDVTVVRQPYVIHQTEPVFRQVYYTDPLTVPYVSHHAVTFQQQPVYHQHPVYQTSYLPAAVNYV
ncbi:uncharacterized protein LOC112693177 [Sipha flava]|uniref:Uncharacterized protein LOC112693177 n=1 Tax=Sipha flava TaxID=143950 RepID=A0A8B8GLR7_9HEMI|nr:uncharacterized protein LOC112693177 [Sipha flava]